jgi:hypothetical protein
MTRTLRAALLVTCLTAAIGQAQSVVTPAVSGTAYEDWRNKAERKDDSPLSDFHLISYFFSRATYTNLVGDPTGLKGVSLGPIGNLAGSSVGVKADRSAFFVEQRWIPVIEYTPFFFDGIVTMRAQFEIDYGWGRAANAVQQNEGGGFNADQVNIQTKNVNAAIYPTRDWRDLAIVIGTQSVYDTVFDPAVTPLSDIVRTGYKLSFLGTDATGLTLYSSKKGHAKLSILPLGSAQANLATRQDPSLKFATLTMADYALPLRPGTVVGVSAWWLHDETQGAAYAYEGLVKSGPSSGGLALFTGTGTNQIDKPLGNLVWVGTNFHHNLDFRTGPFTASGFLMGSFGHFRSQNPNTQLNKVVDMRGLAANLEVDWNYGRTANDQVTLEGMYTTGDSNQSDGTYTGVTTLNTYGIPGAVWFNHRTLLLFPFTSTVNNYTGAVTDISNQGFGLRAGIVSAAYDLIPNKLNLKLGGALAWSDVKPTDFTGATLSRGQFIGAEVNAELKYTIRYLMTVGLHGAYLFRGDFYDGSTTVTANPVALFTTFTWYGF